MLVLQDTASYVAPATQRSSLRQLPVSQVLLKKRAALSAWAWRASSQTCGQASSGCRPSTWRPMPAPCTTSLMLQLCAQLWRLPAVYLRNSLLPRQMTPKGQPGEGSSYVLYVDALLAALSSSSKIGGSQHSLCTVVLTSPSCLRCCCI